MRSVPPHAPNSLQVLLLPDLDRAERIGEFWSYPQSRTFAELLIDFEEDRTLRAVLVGMLREFRLLRSFLGTSAWPTWPAPRSLAAETS